MSEDERALYESIVHGLRMRGMERIDAEDEALERIERIRQSALSTPQATDSGVDLDPPMKRI